MTSTSHNTTNQRKINTTVQLTKTQKMAGEGSREGRRPRTRSWHRMQRRASPAGTIYIDLTREPEESEEQQGEPWVEPTDEDIQRDAMELVSRAPYSDAISDGEDGDLLRWELPSLLGRIKRYDKRHEGSTTKSGSFNSR